MRYEYLRIVLFWVMVATLPGVIFLVQIIMIMPANVMLAHALVGLAKLGQGHFDGAFMLLFGACFLVTALVWLVLATAVARLVCLARNPAVRNSLAAVLVLGMVGLAMFPVYGAGGHGPMRWTNLPGVLADFGPAQGTLIVLVTVAVAAAHLACRRHRLKEAR
jgi:hypothetical protein